MLLQTTAATSGGLAISLLLPQSDDLPAEAMRLLILFSVPALLMGGFAVFFASRTPEGVRRRLRIERPQLPRFGLPLLVLGTWGMWLLEIPLLLFGLAFFDARPEDLLLSKHLPDLPLHWTLIVVTAGAVFPAVGEELLFRGYLQGGLLRWWQPGLSIATTAAMFSIAHLSPPRVLALLPLSILWGLVAYRSRSVLPGMACHFLQNLSVLSVGSMRRPVPIAVVVAIGGAILIGLGCLVAALVLLLRSKLQAGCAPSPGRVQPPS